MEDKAKLLEPLSRDMLDLLRLCPAGRPFVAREVSWSRPGPTGNALTKLSERGLLVRAPDPTVWGRSCYRLTERGAALKARASQ